MVAWKLPDRTAENLEVEVGHVGKCPLLHLKFDVLVPEHMRQVISAYIRHPLLKVPARTLAAFRK